MSNSHEWQFDNAWQEMLNHATLKVHCLIAIFAVTAHIFIENNCRIEACEISMHRQHILLVSMTRFDALQWPLFRHRCKFTSVKMLNYSLCFLTGDGCREAEG